MNLSSEEESMLWLECWYIGGRIGRRMGSVSDKGTVNWRLQRGPRPIEDIYYGKFLRRDLR